MTVSIVMPCFDNLDLTQAAVASIYEHTPEPFELIVVDNGSTDGTKNWLRKQQYDRGLEAIHFPVNRSFAQATWAGSEAATGEYLLHVNNDVVAHAGYLEPLTAVLDAHPEVGAVGSLLLYPDGSIQHAGVWCDLQGGALHGHHYREPREAGEVVAVTAAVMLTRTDLFRDLGGFDQVYRTGNEDVDYCLRLRDAGWKVWYEPASVLTHHESKSAGRFDFVRPNVAILSARWADRPDLWEAA